MADRALPRGLPLQMLERASETLRVLAHPVRLKLVERLNCGEASVGQLARQVKHSQHAVSQHLNQLRLHGLLNRRRDGRHVYYRIRDPQIVGILEWVHRQQSINAVYRDGEAI